MADQGIYCGRADWRSRSPSSGKATLTSDPTAPQPTSAQLPETPYYGRPGTPLLFGLLLLPATLVFVYTMGQLVAGYGPTGFVDRMAAVYIIPLALAPFTALDLLFLHRAWWLFVLHRRGRPAVAAIESIEAETRADGRPLGRTLVRATVSVAGAPPFVLRVRLKAQKEAVEAALPPEGLPIRYDPKKPRRVLVEPSVPGARY